MRKIPGLQFHAERCDMCRYYRRHGDVTECLLLGRTLSVSSVGYADSARFCEGWKRRPKTWDVNALKNPHWCDVYYPREQLLRIRKRLGIKS